ncbi:hypothetical protein GobsT_40420 [Gemmata obscuriglobus]|uniref:Thioester domain-containing protein n=1 Tax=Gemmata obscuriglobus TaxID=114 RepID=A0A2Z3H2V5_9BACT|nr:hypothetical protein [Gemmata obscuriglobus]AWM37896.1 hypothetical protein C1280_13455 [Gemmata obscuriglobus]QEG29251.1 hypothetical protein GobsT_40420 [Gemmata obscuriglobus]VTS08079.1 unnamed protein product [Gemmata obscuriglobus UQM 2246]
MCRSSVRARLAALVAAVPLALFSQTRAVGQEPALEVFYNRLEPKEQFKYKYKQDGKFKESVCSAGVFRWEVPRTEYGTNGLDRNFTGYCAEVLVPIVAEKTYQFRANNLYEPKNFNLAGVAQDKVGDVTNRRARLVQELFGRHFRDPVLKSVDPTDAVAFQIALWEVIQEPEPAQGELKLDLFDGDFQANYPKAEAPVYVTRAQEYLGTLTGKDDALLIENPDLRGRELIRLQGLPQADGSATQSQFALRYAGGGAAGTGAMARALTAGGGGLAGGAGAPLGGGGVGGLGGGTGGGGGFFSNPNNGTTTTTPPGGSTTTTTTTPPTTTTTTPPVGGPDTPTTPTTPTDPNTPTTPTTPTNPVPAPAGLLLGAIALGTVGTWRLGVRMLGSK